MPKPTNPFAAGMKQQQAAPPPKLASKSAGGPKVKTRKNRVVVNKKGY